MIPKTLSASALSVAELCLARYSAQYIERMPEDESNSGAAMLGTTCHAALQGYVQWKYIDKKPVENDEELLKMLFDLAFTETFGTFERKYKKLWDEGWELCIGWLERTDFSGFEVLSVEVKETFPLKTSAGEIPVTYIFDRLDKLGPGEYRVVDYKTSKWNVTHEDLEDKIQARLYAVAVKLKYPDAQRIWVCFDMLRYQQIGRVFTLEENRETYKYIRSEAERIIAATGSEETLNNECRFCPVTSSCLLLRSNYEIGGSAGLVLMEDDNLTKLRGDLDNQIKGLTSLLKDTDSEILSRARENDATYLGSATISVSRRRAVDPERVRSVVGESLFMRFGGLRLNIGDFEALLDAPEVTEEMKAELNKLIYHNMGSPSIRVKKEPKFS